MKQLWTLALVVMASTFIYAQGAPTGRWRGQMPTGAAMVLDLTASNGRLTGTLDLGAVHAVLADGRVTNNTFSFNVTLPSSAPTAFSGEVSGDAITLWMDERGRGAATTLTRVAE